MSIDALNIKPSDCVAVAAQADGSCVILAHDSAGSQPNFTDALKAAAEQAASTNRAVLITHQSIPALRRLLMDLTTGDVPDFLR